MTRPEHLVASRLAAADIEALLDAVAQVADPIRLAFLWRPMLKDPNDDMVLEVAVNGQADRLGEFQPPGFCGGGGPVWGVVCAAGGPREAPGGGGWGKGNFRFYSPKNPLGCTPPADP